MIGGARSCPARARLAPGLCPACLCQQVQRTDGRTAGQHGVVKCRARHAQVVGQDGRWAARRSVVTRRSRASKRSCRAGPAQSVSTRPPFTAPPSTKAAPPLPWSVPWVPFIATSRPNSVATSTTVRAKAPPASGAFSPSRRAASVASSVRRLFDIAPCGVAWLAWLSQPPISSTATWEPLCRNSAALRASATATPRPAPPVMPPVTLAVPAMPAMSESSRWPRARARAGSLRYIVASRALRSLRTQAQPPHRADDEFFRRL